MRPRRLLRAQVALAITGLVAVGCSQSPWNPASADATLSLSDGTGRNFAGGTCDRGDAEGGGEFFLLVIGRPSQGESARIEVVLDELVDGAVHAGDGTGDGALVQHDGGRWVMARSPVALRFHADTSGGDVVGGRVRLMEVATSAEPSPRRWGTLEFNC